MQSLMPMALKQVISAFGERAEPFQYRNPVRPGNGAVIIETIAFHGIIKKGVCS